MMRDSSPSLNGATASDATPRAGDSRHATHKLSVAEVDKMTVAKKQILSGILGVRDSIALYGGDLNRINAALPMFGDSYRSAKKIEGSFAALTRYLSSAIDGQAKKENYRVELTLERAHLAILAYENKRKSEYSGFRVEKILVQNARLIHGAFEDLPSLFSLQSNEIDTLRATWYMTGVMIYRAGIQPSCAENAKQIFRSLLDGKTDFIAAYVDACALVRAPQKLSAEIPLLSLRDLQARAVHVEADINTVIQNMRKLEVIKPSPVTRRALELNRHMAYLVYGASQDLETVARSYIAASGCPNIWPA